MQTADYSVDTLSAAALAHKHAQTQRQTETHRQGETHVEVERVSTDVTQLAQLTIENTHRVKTSARPDIFSRQTSCKIWALC